MPRRAFQITGDKAGLASVVPSIVQSESEFFKVQSRSRARRRQRQRVDFETGALGFKAYEQSLERDLASINPDNPQYNNVYARLLAVRQQRQDLQDKDIMDKFQRGVVSGNEVQEYFKQRLQETAEDTPEFFGLTVNQRQTFLLNLERDASKLQAEFDQGQIGLGEFVSGLKGVISRGSFVDNSPVAVGLRKEISSAEIQTELDALTEEFETAQGSQLLELVDRLDEIKGRFSLGSSVRRSVQGAKQNALQTAYGQFSRLENRDISDIFSQASAQVSLAAEFGDFEQAIRGQELLFGLADKRPSPLSLREFAEQRPQPRVGELRDIFGQIKGTTPSFDEIREAQKAQDRDEVKVGSLLKAFEGF